jgi:hypothetical protein
VGVLVRFATVALGTNLPFLRPLRPSRIIDRTLPFDPRVGVGVEHTVLEYPSLETGAGASGKHRSSNLHGSFAPGRGAQQSTDSLSAQSPFPRHLRQSRLYERYAFRPPTDTPESFYSLLQRSRPAPKTISLTSHLPLAPHTRTQHQRQHVFQLRYRIGGGYASGRSS